MRSPVFEEIKSDLGEFVWRCILSSLVLAVVAGVVALFIFYPLAMIIVVGCAIVVALLAAFSYKIEEWKDHK